MVASNPHAPTAQFPLGRVVATPGAVTAMQQSGDSTGPLLLRHVTGDWGDVVPEDAYENDRSVQQGCRILSAYSLGDGTHVWVVTEADRSSTCILLPEEY